MTTERITTVEQLADLMDEVARRRGTNIRANAVERLEWAQLAWDALASDSDAHTTADGIRAQPVEAARGDTPPPDKEGCVCCAGTGWLEKMEPIEVSDELSERMRDAARRAVVLNDGERESLREWLTLSDFPQPAMRDIIYRLMHASRLRPQGAPPALTEAERASPAHAVDAANGRGEAASYVAARTDAARAAEPETILTTTAPELHEQIDAIEASLDPPIAPIVRVLMENGVETFESCQGGEGHAYPEPTVRFCGEKASGYHALAVALEHGLNVLHLRRVWPIIDGEPTGPYWEMVFLLNRTPVAAHERAT